MVYQVLCLRYRQVREKVNGLDRVDFVELPLAKKDQYCFAAGTRSGKTVGVCDNFMVRWIWVFEHPSLLARAFPFKVQYTQKGSLHPMCPARQTDVAVPSGNHYIQLVLGPSRPA
jgi:hypothetical protein